MVPRSDHPVTRSTTKAWASPSIPFDHPNEPLMQVALKDRVTVKNPNLSGIDSTLLWLYTSMQFGRAPGMHQDLSNQYN